MNKEAFLLYKEMCLPLLELSNEELGMVFRWIVEDRSDLEPTGDFTPTLKIPIAYFKNQFRLDDNKYQDFVEKQRQNALKRWDKDNPKNATASHGMPPSPKNAYNENEKDNENVKEKDNSTSKDVEVETSSTEVIVYGNQDITRLLNGINKQLEIKIPLDGKSRLLGNTILTLLNKYGKSGNIKKDRDWMKDDVWENAKWFMSEYDYSKISKGYSPQSWYKVLDNVKLWITNKGKLEN